MPDTKDEEPVRKKGRPRKEPRPTATAEELAKQATWVEGPIRRRRGTYELRSVGPGERLKVVARAPIQILERHWIHGRSRPHMLAPAKCEGCIKGASIQLKGYLLAQPDEVKTHLVLVELSERALLSCPGACDGDWIVGRWVEVTRLGNRPNGPCQMSVGEVVSNGAMKYPPIPEIRAAIMEIFARDKPPIELPAQQQAEGGKANA
jgi:hypothetical protein